MGFRKTARITRKFPKKATIVIRVEQEVVKNGKYVGAVTLLQGYSPMSDIF